MRRYRPYVVFGFSDPIGGAHPPTIVFRIEAIGPAIALHDGPSGTNAICAPAADISRKSLCISTWATSGALTDTAQHVTRVWAHSNSVM
ncbi:hypothetical protein EVAR_52827_1 [Eumeta japonica]|uniref:Uncharacterized protein n=1 Tax=Eumeta variegata TaxID=151549 RepID=A0A4C1YAF6_EUMVA|nr:hypothetical protein EVAR_52827_1 [Eumeta japonica]